MSKPCSTSNDLLYVNGSHSYCNGTDWFGTMLVEMYHLINMKTYKLQQAHAIYIRFFSITKRYWTCQIRDNQMPKSVELPRTLDAKHIKWMCDAYFPRFL